MLVRHASQYLISSAVTAVIGFASAAVFTRLLTPADYGVYVVGFSMASFVSTTLFTWVRYAVMRFGSEGDSADIRSTSLVAYAISALTAPLIILGERFIANVSWDRAGLAVALALSSAMFDLTQELQRSRLQVRAFLVGSMVRSLAAFGICVAIAELGGGGLGQLAGAALAYLVTSLITGRTAWRPPLAKFEPAKLRLFFVLGVSVTIAALLVAMQASVDRLFIAWKFGDMSAGLYGAGADIAKQIVLIPAGGIAAAAFPLAVRAFASKDPIATRRQLERTGELLLAVLFPVAVGLALTAPYLASFLLGPSFRETAAHVIPILAFAWIFQSISQSFIHLSFHLAMRQDLSIPHGLATLVVNLALLGPLTSLFGLSGAAWSLLASELIGCAVGLALTRRAHGLPSLTRPALRIAAACGVMALVVVALETRMREYSAVNFFVLALCGASAYVSVATMLEVCDARAYVIQKFSSGNFRFAIRRTAG